MAVADGSSLIPPGVVALWAAPRSRSTAVFRYMVERGGLIALHEPFDNIGDYGSTEVNGRLVSDPEELGRTLLRLAETSAVFLKETTDRRHHAVLSDRRFLTEATHTFLIRAPAEIAASCYALQGPRLTLPEIGLEYAYDLHQAILAAGGAQPVVVDSDDLMADPAATMAAYCAATGIPFRRAALHWSPGERDEWRQSARWHAEVSRSSGFIQTATSYDVTMANNAMLADYTAHHEPFYQKLRAHRLTIPLLDRRSSLAAWTALPHPPRRRQRLPYRREGAGAPGGPSEAEPGAAGAALIQERLNSAVHMDCNMDCRPRPVNRCFPREAGAGRRVTAGHRWPTGSGDSRQASARRARRAPARAGRGTTRAALIYQHRTAERDRLIAAAISQIIEAELADPQSPSGTQRARGDRYES